MERSRYTIRFQTLATKMATNEHHEWLKKSYWPAVLGAMLHPDRTRREMSMDDCHIIGSQRKLRHTHMFLPMWACSRFAGMKRPSPHETIKAKLPSTLPVGVEPVLRS